jgi:hypothetical protein
MPPSAKFYKYRFGDDTKLVLCHILNRIVATDYDGHYSIRKNANVTAAIGVIPLALNQDVIALNCIRSQAKPNGLIFILNTLIGPSIWPLLFMRRDN